MKSPLASISFLFCCSSYLQLCSGKVQENETGYHWSSLKEQETSLALETFSINFECWGLCLKRQGGYVWSIFLAFSEKKKNKQTKKKDIVLPTEELSKLMVLLDCPYRGAISCWIYHSKSYYWNYFLWLQRKNKFMANLRHWISNEWTTLLFSRKGKA